MHLIESHVRISKNFLKSSLIYTLAGALPVASAFILLPFYVGFLSTSDFGALSIYFAFSIFIQILTTYSFDTSLYIHFHEYKHDKAMLSSFTSSAFVLMLVIGLCVCLIFTVSGGMIFRNFFPDKSISFYPFGLLAGLTGIFQSLFKVHSNILQSREKPVIYFWSNVLSFSLIAGFTILGLQMYPNSLIGPVGGRLVAACISGVWALSRIFREFGLHFNYPLLRASFSFNFYTFIYQLLQWVINYIDRIIMVFFLTLAQVGVYDFTIKCLLIIEFILNGLHNSFYPKVVSGIMAQQHKGYSPELNRYYYGYTSVIMLLICLCILFFPWAIEIFVDKPDYKESIRYIPYIAMIYIFRAMRLFYAVPYGIMKYTKPLSGIYLIISVIKISIILILVGKYGLSGIIAASIISSIVEIFLLRYNLGDKFTFKYNLFKIVIAPTIIFLLILVLEPVLGKSMPDGVHIFYVFMCLVLLGLAYRKEIRLIYPLKMIH